MSNSNLWKKVKYTLCILTVAGMLACSAGCIQYQEMSNDDWLEQQVKSGKMTQQEADQYKKQFEQLQKKDL